MAQTFEGEVDFTLNGKRSPHRFEVSVTDESKVVVWIEDRQSKKQWHTNALETKDFVTDDNAIPRAKATDYAAKFAACMGSTDQTAKYGRTIATKGSERTLILSLPFQWASEELSVEYKFMLQEVPLERIDILGARVRDVEEKLAAVGIEHLAQANHENAVQQAEIDRLKQRVAELEKGNVGSPVYAQATTKNIHTANEPLVWTASDSDTSAAVEFLSTGRVRFHVAGVYVINISVVHSGEGDGDIFVVKKSDMTLASGKGMSARAVETTTLLHYMLKAEANDEIAVLYTADGYACTGSYMTIVKL